MYIISICISDSHRCMIRPFSYGSSSPTASHITPTLSFKIIIYNASEQFQHIQNLHLISLIIQRMYVLFLFPAQFPLSLNMPALFSITHTEAAWWIDSFAFAPTNINLIPPEKLGSHLCLTCNLTSHPPTAAFLAHSPFLSHTFTHTNTPSSLSLPTSLSLSFFFLQMSVMSHAVHLNVKY